MRTILVLVVCVIASQTVLAEVNYRHVKTPNGGAYTGTFDSNGVRGGFGGGYSSGGFAGGYGGNIGGTPFGGVSTRSGGGGDDGAYGGSFPSFDSIINPDEFERLITGHLESLQRNHARGISMIYATPGNSAYASTSLTDNYNLVQNQLKQQEEFFNTLRNQIQHASTHGGSDGSGGSGGANYASASGSYGPGGIHQTAVVHPENPNSPNVDTRFAAEGPQHGKPGFFGVSSSAFFESSNVNGTEKSKKGAVTTVNDNGKVTTYKSGF